MLSERMKAFNDWSTGRHRLMSSQITFAISFRADLSTSDNASEIEAILVTRRLNKFSLERPVAKLGAVQR